MVTWDLSIIEVGVIPAVPLAAHLPSAPAGTIVALPCYCYLLTDGSRAVLVDTGADALTSDAAGLEIEGDTGALLEDALRARGVAIGDVTLVVHTHLHYDHVGNDLRFPNAEVIVQMSEERWATGPAGPYYVDVAGLIEALGARLRRVEGDTELLPGLRVLWNGGHTPGHQSVLLTRGADETCICGDIVPLFANTDVVGSSCPRTAEVQEFLSLARRASWEMIPSHDPRLRHHASYVRSDPR